MAPVAAPFRTKTTAPPSRPRQWAPDREAVARRREAGHRLAVATPSPAREITRRTGRGGVRVVTPSARSRPRTAALAMAFLGCSAVAAATAPAMPSRATLTQVPAATAPTPAVAPAGSCSPVLLNCCPAVALDAIQNLTTRRCGR